MISRSLKISIDWVLSVLGDPIAEGKNMPCQYFNKVVACLCMSIRFCHCCLGLAMRRKNRVQQAKAEGLQSSRVLGGG